MQEPYPIPKVWIRLCTPFACNKTEVRSLNQSGSNSSQFLSFTLGIAIPTRQLRAKASHWELPTLQDIHALERNQRGEWESSQKKTIGAQRDGRGSENRVRKISICAHRGDERGKKNWVGDEKLVHENLMSEKEMEGGRDRGFLGWHHMGEANLRFIKSLGFDNQTLLCQFLGF